MFISRAKHDWLMAAKDALIADKEAEIARLQDAARGADATAVMYKGKFEDALKRLETSRANTDRSSGGARG